jgi:subtilisin family serine protease
MKVRSLSIRLVLALVAALFPLTAAAAEGKRFVKMDRALRAVAESQHPSPQRVIIQTRSSAARDAVRKALQAHGDVIEAEHPSINALTVVLHGEDLASLDLDANVTDLSSDAEVTVTGLQGTKDTKAAKDRKALRGTYAKSTYNNKSQLPSTLRESLGVDTLSYRGNGIGIAIIDSGIDPNRDLANSIRGFWDFTRGGVPTIAYDDYGHGTHVAGLIASNGTLSQGEFEGVAPDARLFGFKVLDRTAAAAPATC